MAEHRLKGDVKALGLNDVNLMRKRILMNLAVLAVVALLAIAIVQAPETELAESPAQAADADGPDDEALSPSEDPGELLFDPPSSQDRARPMGASEASRLRQAVAAKSPFPHDVRIDDYKRTLWPDILENPPRPPGPDDPELDADLAYRLYMFYGNCSVTPRTPEAVDARLKRITSRANRASDEMLDRVESNANQLLDMYELCLLIPSDVDPRLEAVNWMTKAVRLGHEIAQVQFYDKAKGFLLRADFFTDAPPLVMLHRGLIEEYKMTARYALSQAMKNGHPEAFLAMSEVYREGVIYPRDPIKAYAYLRAAEIQAAQNQRILEYLGRYKTRLVEALNPDQIAEAENLAQEIRIDASTTLGAG